MLSQIVGTIFNEKKGSWLSTVSVSSHVRQPTLAADCIRDEIVFPRKKKNATHPFTGYADLGTRDFDQLVGKYTPTELCDSRKGWKITNETELSFSPK